MFHQKWSLRELHVRLKYLLDIDNTLYISSYCTLDYDFAVSYQQMCELKNTIHTWYIKYFSDVEAASSILNIWVIFMLLFLFLDFHLDGYSKSSALWFFTIHGLFELAFSYHLRSLQKECIQHLSVSLTYLSHHQHY